MTRPVGVTGADPGFGLKGAVSRTLIQTGGAGILTACPTPAYSAVTHALYADTSPGTGGIHTVH